MIFFPVHILISIQQCFFIFRERAVHATRNIKGFSNYEEQTGGGTLNEMKTCMHGERTSD
jgi:hypothetical protein